MASSVIPFRELVANDKHNGAPVSPSESGQVIRLPERDTPAKRFERAFHALKIAQAEYKLNDARRYAFCRLDRSEQPNPFNGEELFEKYRLATLVFATTPVAAPHQIVAKKRVIGRVWLGAVGEFYDMLRAGIAADEARFEMSREV